MESAFTLVKSVAGRDKGSCYAALKRDERYVYIADGRRRKLANPKKKSAKHVLITEETITLSYFTDKQLRKALWKYNFKEGGD